MWPPPVAGVGDAVEAAGIPEAATPATPAPPEPPPPPLPLPPPPLPPPLPTPPPLPLPLPLSLSPRISPGLAPGLLQPLSRTIPRAASRPPPLPSLFPLPVPRAPLAVEDAVAGAGGTTPSRGTARTRCGWRWPGSEHCCPPACWRSSATTARASRSSLSGCAGRVSALRECCTPGTGTHGGAPGADEAVRSA